LSSQRTRVAADARRTARARRTGTARFKLPEDIRIVERMPLNATDKLDRNTLRETVA
jgi:non-ribosomal peptide synthetase component E (peptide arylation enzyme)